MSRSKRIQHRGRRGSQCASAPHRRESRGFQGWMTSSPAYSTLMAESEVFTVLDLTTVGQGSNPIGAEFRTSYTGVNCTTKQHLVSLHVSRSNCSIIRHTPTSPSRHCWMCVYHCIFGPMPCSGSTGERKREPSNNRDYAIPLRAGWKGRWPS